MKDLEETMYKQMQYELSRFNHENSPCNGIENVSIIVHKKKVKNRKKKQSVKQSQHPVVAFRLSRSGGHQNYTLLSKHSSVPEINNRPKVLKQRTKSSNAIALRKKPNFNTKFVVNRVSEYLFSEYLSPFNYPTQKKWKVYRCQLNTQEESCCCSCNSDAMFEVMKSLYDCYKKKNCDNCNCILCGHLPREERRMGEVRKSLASVGLTPSTRERKEKVKKAEKVLEGKTVAEKEKILKELTKSGQPLPKGKTVSEKELVKRVRTELGLPPEPKTAAEKEKMKKATAAGVITPLEGKTTAQKEKILRAQADLGIPLPEGRTASEKALIQKVKTAAGVPEAIPSEKVRKVKAAGLFTPLEGKTADQKEKIIRGLAMQGMPLPEGKTASERKLIDKVRADIGLPPEPKTASMKERYAKAANAGLMQPLEGKSKKDKEKFLQGLADLGVPLPEGRSASERFLIAKVKAKAMPSEAVGPSEKIRKAKAAGLLTPIECKTPEQQEKILRGLAMQGILPEGKTASEKRLIDKVRADIGLPPEPKTASMRNKYAKAADAGLLQPLEGKTAAQKEKILQGLHDMGIPLPEGRTESEKLLIAKVKAGVREHIAPAPSEKLRKAKAAGLLTPLEGKAADQKKEKIFRRLAMQGIPLPEGKTASERKLIDKVRADIGLPPEPKTKSMRDKYTRAADAGLIQPLECKSAKEKEKILQGLHDMGIPLPEGRTKSEKALVAKVKARPRAPPVLEKLRKAKAAGILTPIEGKTPQQQEKILRGLAMQCIPFPEAKTASEKRLIDKVRADLGLPPEPKTASMRGRYTRAADAGLLQPLEEKSAKEKEKILQGLHDMGIPLPEGRTASERSLIAKVKGVAREPIAPATSEKLRKAKAAGLLTPVEGKTAYQKEKIFRGLAMQGMPLPEAKTASDRKLIDKIRTALGLPPEPKTKSMRDKYTRAADAGLIQPLECKSAKEKEKILQGLHDMGIPLPEGRTKSEKALVAKVKAGPRAPPVLAPSEKLRKAKAAGILTPIEGKTPQQQEKILRGLAMQGITLPEAKTASEKRLIDKVRADLGLPPEPKTASMRGRYTRAANAGLLQPLEGKSAKEKEKILQGLHDMGILLPEGRTASERSLIAKVKGVAREPIVPAPSEKLRKAKAAGLLTPVEGKTAYQKEKIFRGLAMQGMPLPEAKTASDRKLIDKIRTALGLPPEPKTKSMRDKYTRAADAGLIQPLECKSAKEKEKILQGLHDMGIPLPEGRTKSEKALVAKVKAGPRAPPVLAPSEKLRKAKAAGILTPIEGKTPQQQEKILRGLAMQGMPLPEAKTASEKRLIDKVRADLGLPPEPKTASMRGKYNRAADAGLLQPLEGKSAKEKEKILQALHNMGIPLPEGRTASEKAIIAKVITGSRAPLALEPAEKLRKAKAAGLLTPLAGKSTAQREKILRGLAMQGVPLPEAKTASEKMLIDKVRVDMGLPPEPKTSSMKDKYAKAADAGILQPLEGKSQKEKERILKGLHDMGIPLPEGRTASEKALIEKVTTALREPSIEKLRKAKEAGLLTPLEGKTPAQKEKILRCLAMQGLPLPEGKTASEKKLANKVRADLGLLPEPKTPSMKEKYAKAANAGLLQPLEGKSSKEKEKILQGLHNMGIPLPEGRTTSEKDLIAKVKAGPCTPAVPSEKLRKAKAAGLLTPIEGKCPAQQEKKLRGLAMQGIPLPEGKTPSEKLIVEKVRADLSLPPAPKTASERDKYNKAIAKGIVTPLEGKTQSQKEKILREQHELGLPLPEGQTSSDKSLIRLIKASTKKPTQTIGVGAPALPPDKRQKLDEKTAKVMKEGKGPIDKYICGLLTPESEKEAPVSRAERIPSEKLRAAKAAGLLTPLECKSPEQKEKIFRGLMKQGLPLPEGKTASEKKLIDKIRTDVGLPPEPKTTSMKEKYAKTQAAGIITPLEGKSASQKEKILRAQADMGVPLPQGRTASEKALIAKIKATTAPSVTTEKLRKAKAACLLTPLEVGVLAPIEGKSIAQKEKILRGRAAACLAIPAGKTTSEKVLIEKIKKDTGYVSPSPAERMKRAKAAGLLTPIKGKTASVKEKILRERMAARVPFNQCKTPSEEEIIKKITAGVPPPVKKPSERIREAKAAGLLTPLEGKSPKQKEKNLRCLIKTGAPLPEPKTSSEKKLIAKIRNDVGLPPEPKTPSQRDKYKKAHDAGIITPLECKSTAEKEKILKRLHDAGIPLPEGSTNSEKAMIKRIKAELPERKVPSEKVRAARSAGLLTPLEGKTAVQKEKIIKGLVKAGMPVPEGKTASEKAIIHKIRTEVGLPPTPATSSLKVKMQKAQAAGVITPLEGKTAAQKEQILRKLAEAGVPLPEGGTASEKALITKVKTESKAPTKITPEKLKKAKEAGLLTPLKGKPAKEQERIMKGLVEQGLPLPEGQTASEKKIAEKIRKDVGLPPMPKTSSEKERVRKAEAAGIITPLEGKIKTQKERILRDMAHAGVELPEGRTISEKAIIKKIQAKVPPFEQRRTGQPALPPEERSLLDKKTAIVMKEGKGPSDECICGLLTPESEREALPSKIPSDKIKKAKAAGLLTPLEGKTTAEKEKLLRGLAEQGLPLPEAKTAIERKLTSKVRKEIGLPPEPKTASMKEKQKKAAAAGVLVPLEGLSSKEKEKVLKTQADVGIDLPEGRTASEKALIAKVKAETKAPPTKMPSEKLRKAKEAGLLTPLKGKKAKDKERIIRCLAKEGISLPEAETASERKIIDKVRKELALPPEPKTASIKERHEKAAAAGVLVPLEGLSSAEKEKVLKAQADMGIVLPKCRTTSEKALIAKVKAETKAPPTKVPSEKLRKAKEAGLLTPLKGKKAKDKERKIRCLAKEGIPLPEAETASERKIIDKVRKELALPPEPKTASIKERHEKAAAAGVLVPLEGLSSAEKEKVLKAQADMGIALPEGRTTSEKALIAKVKAGTKAPPTKVPSEKLRKAKEAGLLTPLKGKKAKDKVKIIRGLAKEGIPLPEAETASERKIIDKVRKELRLPPVPKTASMKGKHEKAAAAGVLVPLGGLSSAEKEKVLRAQADMGIELPEGRTASEKALITKIKAVPAPLKVSSEKLRKAKAAGLLTPLEGKTQAQKEKIIRSLAEAGLPLPEGKTKSEKALIHKVRTELGIPPLARTASEKAIVRKAQAEGLLTPIAGKSAKEKERIRKGLAEAGLTMPEGKTTSEKELVRKVRTGAGLPSEPTPSEKLGEIKTKSKRIGVTPTKKVAKGIGVGPMIKSKAGIGEEYEDIIKTTTCERGCGCDKKKIRFKHSYIKIRVTSPDISSLCPCPEECLPGVKSGAFIDNEGIKVTVGRVDGVTSYTSQYSNHILESSKNIITLYDKNNSTSNRTNTSNKSLHELFTNKIVTNDLQKPMFKVRQSQKCTDSNNKMIYEQLYSSSSYTSDSYDSHSSFKPYKIESDKTYPRDSKGTLERWIHGSDRFLNTPGYLESSTESYTHPVLMSYTSDDGTVTEPSSRGSFESIIVIKSESSLSLSTLSSSSVDVISVISYSNSSGVSNSTHYLYCPISGGNYSDSTVEELECFNRTIDYSTADTVTSDSSNVVNETYQNEIQTILNINKRESGTAATKKNQNEYLTFRMSKTNLSHDHNITKVITRMTNTGEPVIVINNLDSEHDITMMVDELLSNNEFSDASSIFVVVPTSDDNDSDSSSDSNGSTICMQISGHHPNWNISHLEVEEPVMPPRRFSSTTRGVRVSTKGRKYFMEGMQNNIAHCPHKKNTIDYQKVCKHKEHNDSSLMYDPKVWVESRHHGVSTDTTSDRPCCCAPKIRKDVAQNLSSNHRCVANVVSELITPLLINQGLGCNGSRVPRLTHITQQASFISLNQKHTPVTTCRIPACGELSDDPPDMDQNPCDTKKTDAQPCQCSPEKLKELLEQAIKAGKAQNLKSVGCGGAVTPPAPAISPLQQKPISKEEDCATCPQPKHKDGATLKCFCSGKKRTVKLRPLCPCEQHQPPVSRTIPGPKAGTRSLGCQCCVCEDSTLRRCPEDKCPKKLFGVINRKSHVKPGRQIGDLEFGPAGGLVLMEQGGTYTQAGMRPPRTRADTSTNTRKSCACPKQNGKKKTKVICECPPAEPEPEPEPDIEELQHVPPMEFSSVELEKLNFIEHKQALKQRSDMTQTQSGFKMFKKRKPPPQPEAELTVEEAIRYYASMHPHVLQDICPPPPEYREDLDFKDCSCEGNKLPRSDLDCICPYEPPPPPPPPPPPEPEPAKEDEGPRRGFKFSMGGKGSCSKGLSGVCCFDMIHEINNSRQRPN